MSPAVNGAQLKKIRQNAGMTQKELAQILGVHKNSIGNIERGSAPASGKFIRQIADALKTSPDNLYLSQEDIATDSGYNTIESKLQSDLKSVHPDNQIQLSSIVIELKDKPAIPAMLGLQFATLFKVARLNIPHRLQFSRISNQMMSLDTAMNS